jgi:pyroglutamyl-peptidase
MLLVTRLEKEADTLSTMMDIQIIRTLIFETSAEAVRQEIDSLCGEIMSASTSCGVHMDGCHVVFLHLGVNYRGKKFHLEQCAYNDATFRVPDERGYQPQGLCIIGDTALMKEGMSGDYNSSVDAAAKKETVHKFGKCYKTTLALREICSKLQENGDSQPVCVSNDPGRFVCNFTYCLSLHQCRSWKASSKQTNGTTPSQYHSLFVHVPPFAVIPEEDQFNFIIEIMKAIQSELISSME